MNREMLMLVDAISREKNVERDLVFGAVESALAQATKKLYPGDVIFESLWTATVVCTKLSAVGWWCPMKPVCKTLTLKKC